MVTWGRAWRAAATHFGWSIIWGLAGIGLIIGGIIVMFMALLSSFQSSFPFYGGYNIPWSGIILGSVLIGIGALVVNLGERAAFFKVSSEVISEEVNRQLQASKPAICPTCGGQLRFIEQAQRWYCDREAKYV